MNLKQRQRASCRRGVPKDRWKIPIPGDKWGEVKGVRFTKCQWIEGEPSYIDKDCKCGRRTVKASAYCSAHYKRAYRVRVVDAKAMNVQARVAA